MAFELAGSVILDDNRNVVAGAAATFTGDISIADKIIHSGDTDTFLEFGSDTISLETGGSERLRIGAGGTTRILGTTSVPGNLFVSTNRNTASNNDVLGSLIFGDSEDNKPAFIRGVADATYNGTTTDTPVRLEFHTTPDSSGTSVERLRIDSSGNVGIGTDNPDTNLHVEGTGTDILKIESHDAGAQGVNLIMQHSSASPAADDVISLIQFNGLDNSDNPTTYSSIRAVATNVANNSETGDITFHTRNGSDFLERLRIKSNGNVGIGTIDPGVKLDVRGTSRFTDYVYGGFGGILFINDSVALSATKKLYFDTGSNTYIHEQSADNLAIVTGGTERLRIDANGDINLGDNPTNQYGYKLNIEDSAIIYAQTASSGGTELKLYLDHSNTIANFGTVSTSHLAFVTANTEKLRITSAGNVGIGTTNPDALLHLKSASSPTIHLEDTSQTTKLKIYSQDTSAVVGTYSNHDLIFTTNSASERLFISKAGNVGIATNNPSSLLDVHGANGAGQIRLVETNHTNTNRYGKVMEYAGNLYFQSRNDSSDGGFVFRGEDNSDTVEFLRIESNGRVAIGTATDIDHILCVAGDDDTTSLTGGHNCGIQLQNHSGTDGTYSQIEWRTSSGGRYARIAGIQDDANGNGGQLVFLTETSGGTTTEAFRIDSSGNSKFISNERQVIIQNGGTAGQPEIAFRNATDTGDAYGNIDGATLNFRIAGTSQLYINGSGDVGINTDDPGAQLHVQGSGSSSTLNILTTDNSGNNVFYAKDGGQVGLHYYPLVINQDTDDTATPSNTYFYVHHTSNPFIIKNDGKVGIGSDNPGEVLDVNGTIQCLNELRSKTGNDLLLNAGSVNRDVKIQVNDVNMLYVKGDTGNVGIGSDEPDQKLVVAGILKVYGSDGESYGARINPNSAGGTYEALIGSSNGDLRLQAGTGSYQANRANILLKNSGNDVIINAGTTSGGNVGIQSATPSAVLDIGNTGIASATALINADAWDGQVFNVDGNVKSNSIFAVNDVSGLPVIDFNATHGLLSLAPFGGNVSIGYTNSGTKLGLKGSTSERVYVSTGSSLSNVSNDRINIDNGNVHYYSVAETGGNLTAVDITSNNTLNADLAIGDSVTVVVIIKPDSTSDKISGIEIDGSAVTEQWLGGSAPDGGANGSYDVYTFFILKTADATFLPLCNKVNFT